MKPTTTKRRLRLRRSLLTSLLAIATVVSAGYAQTVVPEPEQPVLLQGRTMGTTYRVKYWPPGSTASSGVHQAIERLLEKFDRQMSTYREDSELSQFNRADANKWFEVSAETAHVASEALRYREMTAGALDVTVLPLLRAWNFGPDVNKAEALQLPDRAKIDGGLQLVGAGRLRVQQAPPALWKDRAGVEVDFSSLAPGRAVDLIIELLRADGIANAMVELGGEVRGMGTRPDGEPWLIGVESVAPTPQKEFARIVALKDLALSTAGDYHNFKTADGRQFTHIIDPRSGQALPFRGVAVTVIASTCLEADALDTPLVIMGPTEGYQWCIEHGVAAFFQWRGNDGAEPLVKATPRFQELTKD